MLKTNEIKPADFHSGIEVKSRWNGRKRAL